MAYTAWSVVFGEQPTAAKWNQLGENDAGFKTGVNIDDDAILARHINWAATGANGGVWWEELGRTTLGAVADTITVSGLGARKYLRILAFLIPSSSITCTFRFNNDAAANYAYRISTNNGADTINASQTTIGSGNSPLNMFTQHDVINTVAQEKQTVGYISYHNGNGAANTPQRDDVYGKWANTVDQITRVDFVNGGPGDYAAGSEVIVLGHN